MKKFWFIIPAILVTASSCTSLSFTGTANDDLYYRPSEQPVTAAQGPVQPAGEGQAYYDNIFAADTLIADEYIPDNEYIAYNTDAGATVVNNYYGSSAAERIYLFNDDHFYPYWRDPFYFSPFSARLGLGYGYWGSYRYPYSWGYDPFMSDWYSPWSYYSPYYSSWGGYPYYNYFGYNSFNPWFSGFGYLPYYNSYEYPRTVGRRGGYSTMSRGAYTTSDTRNKSGYAPSGTTLNSRRTAGTSAVTTAPSGTTATSTRRTAQESGTYTRAGSSGTGAVSRPEYSRRDAAGNTVQTQSPTRTQSTVRPETQSQTRTQSQTQYQSPSRTQTQTQSVNRPQYQTTERTYTPSYNTPRVSSRPSYNTTRNSGTVQSTSPAYNRSTPAPGRSSSGYSPSRSSSPSVQYSAPSRSSSSPSYNRSSSSGSSSSSSGGRSSSYSSGSSSSSGSSYSSGSSSSSSPSSSSSSSSSTSTGGRR